MHPISRTSSFFKNDKNLCAAAPEKVLIRDIIYSKPRTSVPKTTSPPRHIQQSPQNRAINPAPIMREYEHYPHPHHNGPHHNEETVKRTWIARPLHAIKKDIMETLGDDRGQEKRMDDRIQRQFEREERPVMAKPAEKQNESWLSDNYTEADTGFNLNDMEALNMILTSCRQNLSKFSFLSHFFRLKKL